MTVVVTQKIALHEQVYTCAGCTQEADIIFDDGQCAFVTLCCRQEPVQVEIRPVRGEAPWHP